MLFRVLGSFQCFKFLYSTCFKVLTRSLPSNLSEVAILDAMSGKPLQGVVLSFFDRQNKQLLTATTNTEGKVQFASSEKYRYLTAAKGK